MRFKILLIAIIIIAAILAYFLYKQVSIPAPILQAEPLKTKASLIGTVQETRQVTIGSQDYIDKYIDWQFREINSTQWTADFSFTEPFFSDLRRCLNNPSDTACWEYIQNTYLPDYSLNEIRIDLLNMKNYPLRNLTAGISFSNFQIDLTSGTGSFLINFPNGFKLEEYAELGFGSTIISTSTSTSLFSSNGKSICRTTNRIHVVYPSVTVRYTNSTDGITWGNSIQLDGSQGSDNPNINVLVECSGNNVFVSWHDGRGGVAYMNSSNEGGTWSSNATGGSAPRLTSIPYGGTSVPIASSMFLPNTNNIFLALWNTTKVGVISFNTSTYTGAADPTSTNTTIFAPPSSYKHIPAIYINSSGVMFVATINAEDTDLYFNFSSDEGVTWTGKKVSGAVTYNYPDIVQMNGTIYVVTHDSSNDIQLHNSTNDGVTWGSPVRLDTIGTGTSLAQYPSLTTDGANLYVFWQENDTVNNRAWEIRYRKWNISSGWDNVVYWQNFSNSTYDGSSLNIFPNAKRGNSSNLIEVVWQNRSAESGSLSVMYDFINLTVEGGDSTPPTFSNMKANTTIAGNPVNFSVVINDETGLSGYIFETNNTGTFVNTTWVALSSGGTASNITTLNSTVGVLVNWTFYANDTSNNWAVVRNWTTTAVDIPPTWSNNATNSTLAGTWVNHSVVLTDETSLDYYIFEFDNGTGTLTNITNMSISGTTVTANQTVLINYTFNSTVRWRYYFNDTSNNWNSTYLFNYTTSGIILSFVPPTQDNATTITVNSTYINVSVTQNTSAIDTILFQWNFSGKNTNVTIYNTSELVGLWHLNNDTLDYSGNGNDLTLANGVNCSTNVQGMFGTACDFAGDDDRLDGGSNSSIDDIFTGGGTAMAWIYLDSYGTNNLAYIAGKGTPGTSGWIFWVTGATNAIQFNTYFSTFGGWVARDELSTGRWIHVAVTYNDGSTANDPILYVNGKNVTIDSETTPTGTYQSDASNNTFIGGRTTDNERNFNGTIDEVRFYKRILSSDEINITYRSELGKYINSTVFFQNFTDMADGAYRYKSYGKMTDGTWNSSEERTLTVAIPPIWSNNQSSIPSKYSTALSIFNITWTDNAAISTAFLESNFSGSPTNYTMWSTGNVYSYNNTLPAGSFYWKSYANDTSNNWNVSDTWYFTIDKGTLELSITSPQTVTYPVQTTVTGSETNIGDTDVTYQLWRNSSASNPLSLTTETNALGVGAHLYTYNTTAGTFANWTVNTTGVNTTVTVSQNQTNPINIFFTNSTGTYKNQNITVAYGESTTANATLVYSNAGTASLFEDNSSVANPRTTTLSVGNHSYKGNTSGNVNYTANATGATYYITVTPVTYTISINLNATQVWWNDSTNISGYAASGSSPFSGWIQVNRSNDTTIMCNTTTSNGYYSCVFYAPPEIGNYNYTSYMLSQTGSVLIGNSTILTVMLSYGSEYPGKNVGVYEAPVIIQELNGKIKIVWVKIKTWFNR